MIRWCPNLAQSTVAQPRNITSLEFLLPMDFENLETSKEKDFIKSDNHGANRMALKLEMRCENLERVRYRGNRQHTPLIKYIVSDLNLTHARTHIQMRTTCTVLMCSLAPFWGPPSLPMIRSTSPLTHQPKQDCTSTCTHMQIQVKVLDPDSKTSLN